MEKMYLPSKFGKTLGIVSLTIGGLMASQAIEGYRSIGYYQGQHDVLIMTDSDTALKALNEVEKMRMQIVGQTAVGVGFTALSGAAFYLSQRERNRNV
jgi:hypothetical protein